MFNFKVKESQQYVIRNQMTNNKKHIETRQYICLRHALIFSQDLSQDTLITLESTHYLVNSITIGVGDKV